MHIQRQGMSIYLSCLFVHHTYIYVLRHSCRFSAEDNQKERERETFFFPYLILIIPAVLMVFFFIWFFFRTELSLLFSAMVHFEEDRHSL